MTTRPLSEYENKTLIRFREPLSTYTFPELEIAQSLLERNYLHSQATLKIYHFITSGDCVAWYMRSTAYGMVSVMCDEVSCLYYHTREFELFEYKLIKAGRFDAVYNRVVHGLAKSISACYTPR